MATPPNLVEWLLGNAGESDIELVRRACKSAWELDEKHPVRLLPPPAGMDEARMRFPGVVGPPPIQPPAAPLPDPAVPPTPTAPAPVAAPGSTVEPMAVPKPVVVLFPDDTVEMCPSELDVARLIERYAEGHLSWIREEDKWLVWHPNDTGGEWRVRPKDSVQAAVSVTARMNLGSTNKDGETFMRPAVGGKASTASGAMKLLSGLVGTSVSQWDAVPNLVGVPTDKQVWPNEGGVLDIRTGQVRPAVREDRIRWSLKTQPVTPAEYQASRFRQVIEHVVPDMAERAWLQTRLGAALMDVSGHDDFIWLYGPSGSGKGVLVRALRAVFGDYVASVPPKEILRGGHRGHPEWHARLANRRLLMADDLASKDIDESVIKTLLGSEQTANHMRQASFDFTLFAPFLVTANHPPAIRSMDPGLRRRLRPITGGTSIENKDAALRELMSSSPAESGACLRWLLDGAAAYVRDGLMAPQSILVAADDAMNETPVAVFGEQWTPDLDAWTGRDAVYQAYKDFMKALGQKPDGNRSLARDLRAIGWQERKKHGVRGWCVRRTAEPAPVQPAEADAGEVTF